ncbi:SGNH/GDSL hydrolase family protein [Kitasatospora sp. NPDC048365]|uniref:SGNH/GDSL hydrolase family protein n=1 Tax=Kitasatospora sp. NPDC048365 TaxID=3364050 RepID=UPI003718088F
MLRNLMIRAVGIAATVGCLTTLTAPGAAAQQGKPLKWVAMGDSYMADVMVPSWQTPAEADGCGRSRHDWEQQLADHLNTQSPGWVQLTDVTCGSATVKAGILGRQTTLLGPPFNDVPEGGYPARPPQVDSIAPDTDVVTVGIGGNDLGFGPIMTKCMELGAENQRCQPYFETGPGRPELDAGWANLREGLADTMQAIKERAPQAKVFVMGYPAVAGAPIQDQCKREFLGIPNFYKLGSMMKEDAPWFDEVEQGLNYEVESAAAKAGATYVDTYTSSIAHGACLPSGGANQPPNPDKWMYGVFDKLVLPPGVDKPAQSQYHCGMRDEVENSLPVGVPFIAGEACTLVHPNYYGAQNQMRQAHTMFEGVGLTPPNSVVGG